jgi:hypothetical protein
MRISSQALLGAVDGFGAAAQHHHVAGLQGRFRRHFHAALPRRMLATSAPDAARPAIQRASHAGRAAIQRDRMQAFHVGLFIHIAHAVEVAAQRGVALARRLHPVHHAPQRHAQHHQRVRGQHQAALHQFRHHFRRAGLLEAVQIGVVVRAHDHRQRRRQLVHLVQHAQRRGVSA